MKFEIVVYKIIRTIKRTKLKVYINSKIEKSVIFFFLL